MSNVGSLSCSAVVLMVWAAVTVGIVPPPTDGSMRILDVSLGTVLCYWLGSSRGSAIKTELLAAASAAIQPPDKP